MATAKWLRIVISPLPSKPSLQLKHFLTSCDRDVTGDVICRAKIILEAIFPSSSFGQDCDTRRLEAIKLYYKVLEAICTAEAKVLRSNNLTSLLTNERFHRCMLSCSAELVLASYKTATMLFPAVLERTSITAFDLSKVIECFIRHEESLPRELRRHLNSLEERLLESMVWEKGSSMYNSLIVARPSLSSEINHLRLLAEPMPSLDEIAVRINFSSGILPSVQKHELYPGENADIRSPKRPCPYYQSVLVERNSFTLPMKNRLRALNNVKSKLYPPPLQSAFASPTHPNPVRGGETCAETAINIFFGKITKLAAVRINSLIERLPQFKRHIKEHVYRLFQQLLSQRTALFFNHHIDQIILCCIYIIAKSSEVKLPFWELLGYYEKQPQCKPHVFRSVFVDWSFAQHTERTGQDHVDLITFYNKIFVSAARPLLAKEVPEVNNNEDGHISAFPSLPDMSPMKVSPRHNVYVSPLRTSKMDALISHSSKSFYACVGESTRAFQSPSKDLTAINRHLHRQSKVRGTLNFDVDVGLVSDSEVTKSLFLPNGNFTSSSVRRIKSEQPDS
ncbi:Retinoblastoma-related protein [Euphorbia peplus]|nr:Retinoblastoma-related protein [Euphorbia peplus]